MDKKTRNLINLGALKCCLCGLAITDQKDYSIEHYAPKSRTIPALANNPYNLRPAFKILNCIKGDLLPCQWHVVKIERCYRALKTYNLKARERRIVQQAIRIYENEQPVNPCTDCILSLSQEHCEQAKTR